MYAASYGSTTTSTAVATSALSTGSGLGLWGANLLTTAHLVVAAFSLFALTLAMLKLLPRRSPRQWAAAPVQRPTHPLGRTAAVVTGERAG